ncbi:low choriolytic enzyme-like [Actinia tenebrosa]|uniref:Metalloendopeptidase n=1 Tax=Actinia tenebrosa TaxID=6105 RepID=A0A6P8HE49_ACTTE|nr:low choriolytic enzyme-like [Actinia tenebrosa]
MILILVLALCGLTTAVDHGMYDPNLFEGDMLLTPEQKAAVLHGVNGRASVNTKLWPDAVLPYTIDASLANDARGMRAIRAGMKLWTDSTCVRFKPRTNERNYAHFYIGGGCSSHVGPIGGKQYISLARGCWMPSIVSHEIGHCLGFFHEQSRPDRDNYVTIIWNNIPQAMRFNFNKLSSSQIDSLGTPYDYASVMHYDRTAFGSGRETIRPKQAGVTLGNKRGPTAIDIKQMNLLYKCSGGGGGGGATQAPVTQAPVTQAPVTQAPVTQAPVTQAPGGCVDKDNRCPTWPSYCQTNDYVKANCKKTCNLCGGGSCQDTDRRCPYWPRYCKTNAYVQKNCRKTCGLCS